MPNTTLKSTLIALPLCLAFSATAALAHEGHDKCAEPVQQCLDHMAKKFHSRGWVGIEMDQSEGTMKLITVVPDSPASKAGLQVGDVLVAVNGVPFGEEKSEALEKATSVWTPGTLVTYSVLRAGKTSDMKLTLGEMPEKVRSQMIGYHMMMHVSEDGMLKVAFKDLSVEEVAKVLTSGKGVAVDVNQAPLRKSHGTLPGAKLLTSSSTYDVAKELPSNKEQLLVFYCANTKCMACETAAHRAAEAGYKNVAVMRAGIMGWKDAGQKTAPLSS